MTIKPCNPGRQFYLLAPLFSEILRDSIKDFPEPRNFKLIFLSNVLRESKVLESQSPKFLSKHGDVILKQSLMGAMDMDKLALQLKKENFKNFQLQFLVDFPVKGFIWICQLLLGW